MNEPSVQKANVIEVQSEPFEGQRPGTSGLRKKVSVFKKHHYLQNFVQSIFNALDSSERNSLVLGGDGRYFNASAIQIIVRMAVANGYQKVFVCQDGLCSTPGISHLIRSLGADGGIILSASHNPAGPEEDFGIKYNNRAGSPAPESITDRIYEQTQRIRNYSIIDCDKLSFVSGGGVVLNNTAIEVVDPVAIYGDLMGDCFDFDLLRPLISNGDLTVCFDAMNAVTGPFAEFLLCGILGASPESVVRSEPLEDFGGLHPDPCPKYASELIAKMFAGGAPDIGVASDGDGDRNMIVGRSCMVSPGDSLAIIAHHANLIPQFQKGIRGVARSMPTSRAVDKVAHAKGIDCFETPTGWKYFGNLLDAGLIQLCGEESFGTSGDHIREKDGVWAMMCWLTIMARTGKSVEELVREHWEIYGRYLYGRYDYEGVAADSAARLMDALELRVEKLSDEDKASFGISGAKNFSYIDPVDASETSNQGIEIYFEDDSRVVYRLSGTGTAGATLRVYLEQFDSDCTDPGRDVHVAIEGLAEKASAFARIEKFVGMNRPSGIV